MWYRVSEPNAYLAITGLGIEKVDVKKKAWVYPFQKCAKFSITPFDFSLNLQAMTIEKLNFSLPAVFTIGPEDTNESLVKYAVLLTGESSGGQTKSAGKSGSIAVAEGRGHVQNIVKGIIEGETRSIVSTMTMEELFKERRIFRDKVIKSVQEELLQFGLKIYNANVKELQDTPGSEYFNYLSRKAHEGALNQAKVDVAEARMKGEVGEADRQGKTKQEIARINATTAVLETERKAEKAKADAALTEQEIQIAKELKMSRIHADREAEKRDAELQKNVEEKRAAMELERQRATTVTKARIQRESDQEKAMAALFTQEKNAEADKFAAQAKADSKLYANSQDAAALLERQTKEAEAAKVKELANADANFYSKQKAAAASYESSKRAAEADQFSRERDADATVYATRQGVAANVEKITSEAEARKLAAQNDADARFYAAKMEAQGLVEMARAYGAMGDVLGGPAGLLQWMMMERGVYERLAESNAKAVKDMQPKINVWNTGPGAEGADNLAPIRGIFQSLPPLLSTIQDQTGMTPPSWLASMPATEGKGVGEEGKVVKKTEKGCKSNGIS